MSRRREAPRTRPTSLATRRGRPRRALGTGPFGETTTGRGRRGTGSGRASPGAPGPGLVGGPRAPERRRRSNQPSASANEMATCALGMPIWWATTAEAYSHGSRSTKCGDQSPHACRMPGSMAVVAIRPNRSRFPSSDASRGGATGRRSLIGATSASGGSPPAWNAWPARRTRSRSAGGPTMRVSSPRRWAAARKGSNGSRWPAPPREQAASTRIGSESLGGGRHPRARP